MTCIFPLGKCYDSPHRSAMKKLVLDHPPCGSRIDPAQGQTPGSPSPTYQQGSRSPFQPSYQGQNSQNQARAQREIPPQYQGQEPYHPPYERQTLVQQVRQQQQQQPPQPQQGYQTSSSQPSYEREGQQQYFSDQRKQPYQQDTQHYQNQQHGVQQQQQYYYGQEAQSYHGQAQPIHQNLPPGDSYSNPRTIFFHMLFKSAAIILYVLGGWITSSFVLQFVAIVLLVAFDFWTVKNVSGRILVGLRYWNESDDNGRSLWRFESLDRQSLERLNQKDTMLFWTSLYVTPALWTLFGLVAALKLNFDYLMIVIIALTMCVSNIIGFTKCRKDAKKKVQSLAQQAMGGFMREAMTGGVTSNISKVFNIF